MPFESCHGKLIGVRRDSTMYPLGMEIAALSPLWVVSNRREGHPGSLGKVDFTPFSIRIASGYKMQEEGWGEIGGFA